MPTNYEKHPFLLGVDEVANSLGTNVDSGLTTAQVQKLQQEFPPNELDAGGAIPWYSIFLKQLFNAMVLVLFFAMALSFGIKDWIEGGVLAAVIVLNVSIGFVQEYRAEKKMDALRALSSPSATILRDGKTQVIPNAEVVPGDIVILKMGDTVPADLRLFEVMNLSCDEQSLTGESMPVDKIIENNIKVPGSDNMATADGEVGIGDRVNIAYATTIVRKGRGRGIVIETGMQTEVGKIAASTKKKPKAGRSMNWRKYGKRQPLIGALRRIYDFLGKFLGLTEGTPLQKKLAALAYILFGCALILAIIVFGVNRFHVPHDVLIYAISTGIAIIPESLVAVLTITMVQATRVMRKANVVVRDLSALEALGGVTNICSDKTGTLTQGAMIVKKVWLPASKIYTVRDSMDPSDPTVGSVTYSEKAPGVEEPKRDYDAERSAGALTFDVPDEKLNPTEKPKKANEPAAELNDELRMFLLSTALCNLATVRKDQEKDKWMTTGEPTEIALQIFAWRFERGKKSLEAKGWKQVSEFPFDSTIKRMSVVYNAPEDNDLGLPTDNSLIFTKGAVERVIDLCTHMGQGEAREEMTDEAKDRILEQMDDFASQGQRVLAIAYRSWDGIYTQPDKAAEAADPTKSDDAIRSSVESGLTLLGLVGIYDPPRKETTPAIRECSNAGIRVHMLTGDHPATAAAIAKEVGILPFNMSVLPAHIAETCVQKATDFDKLTDEEIDAMEELPLVIARCAPDTKTRMIEALRRRSAFMAMTGDGVNDAPSLSNADVGIAMGSGSDVAKSASKIVLTDDKFNSIVAAIREGRRMFENIQKFVLHLLTSNVGEVILLIAGLGFQDESGTSVFPISPLQILWINMLTSSFPAFGLGREKASNEIMRKPPHSTKRGVFTNQIIVDMLVYGFIMGVCTLMTFVIIVYGVNNGELGDNCNTAYSPRCDVVFRARAAVFAELTWLILFSAWEFKSLRRSMFRLNPDSDSKFPFFKDVYENRFLFWSVILAFISVFGAIHIPVVNENVFRHKAIGWEYGLAFGGLFVFIVGVEAWKFIKRKFNLLDDHAVVRGPFSQGSEDPEGRSFVKTMSFSSFKSWSKSSLRSRSRTRTQEKNRDN
ncbi:hypothetical protein RB601_006500 [Gaeumannomyces tritici]